jgi:GFO/IDH/MocA oxidoreductase family protein
MKLWNYGFPQEMHHFARCARGKETPIATGEDGRIVQEVLLAGYRSARRGAKIGLPFRPTGIKRLIFGSARPMKISRSAAPR